MHSKVADSLESATWICHIKIALFSRLSDTYCLLWNNSFTKILRNKKGFISLFILICRCSRSFSTKVEPANQNPVWAGKHVFPNIAHEDIGSVQLDVTVWNFSHSAQHECIGNILIVFLMKKPQWPFFGYFDSQMQIHLKQIKTNSKCRGSRICKNMSWARYNLDFCIFTMIKASHQNIHVHIVIQV